MHPAEPLTVRVVGFGMGPDQLTPEAVAALRRSDYVVAAQKSADDPLLAVRHEIAHAHGLELVPVADPERDRSEHPTHAAYERAVQDWHAARVRAYADVLRERGGSPAFLVWGDPALYDSTIRIVRQVAESVPLRLEVVPGISAPQLLAARHAIVLHEIGQPLHVTTARAMHADIAAGQRNLCVMLSARLDLTGLEDWSIWWGANLGTAHEQLVHGPVGEVTDTIAKARERARQSAGWVMDTCLLRAPGGTS